MYTYPGAAGEGPGVCRVFRLVLVLPVACAGSRGCLGDRSELREWGAAFAFVFL